MLKILFAAIIIITIPLITAAQGIRMGLSFSPQTSWIKTDIETVSSQGVIMGFNFGLQSDFFFTERYSLSTGLFINKTGGKLMYSDTIEFKTTKSTQTLYPNTEIKYNIRYIEVPLSFRMESNKIGYFVYHAQFGITNQFRVGATCDIESITPTNSFSLEGANCTDEINFYNLGYNIGAGFNYYFSKNTALTLGVVYTNSFLDVTSNSIADQATLQSIALRIGVLF